MLKEFIGKLSMTSKTVVIHQPDFLPYLGFFHRFLCADLYVILDNVQFLHNSKSWHHRDKIKTPQGAKWITVSVIKAPRETKINEIILTSDVNWRERNLNLIIQNYRKSPYFKEIFPHIEELYSFRCHKMMDFNIKSIQILMSLFDLKIESRFASELNPKGKNNELLVDILQKVGATHYLSGMGAKDYYDPLPFNKAGIKVLWQDFNHPVYLQLFGDFIPFISSIDLLFNCGVKESRRILRSL